LAIVPHFSEVVAASGYGVRILAAASKSATHPGSKLNSSLVSQKVPSSPQLGFLFEADPEVREQTSPRRSRNRRTWLVSQLVAEAREAVEAEFGDVWVEGEISNLRPALSGHLYFTLKDADAQLPVVLFRRQALLLRFRPEDGLHVRVRGKVSVYEQRGQLQLVAETMEPVGAGNLQLAFELLRDKLKAEGLFDQERKRALPAFPRTVAVVTSPTGAVIRDFLNIAGRRYAGLNVVVVPVAVQGDSAAVEIELALAQVNEGGLADLIVLARGGGSLEDLAPFNSERVARAIAASDLPVVSAVGHETDFTIADFVADLRAPTPSAAAELITEAHHKVEELVAALSNRLTRAARFQILQARQRFGRVAAERTEQRVTTALHRRQQRLDDLSFHLESAISEQLGQQRRQVAELTSAVLRQDPRRRLAITREMLAASRTRLNHAMTRSLAAARHRSQSLSAQLQSLSPLAVLQRGYALVQDENGTLVRSVTQVNADQAVHTRLSDGTFTSKVTATVPNKNRRNSKRTI